jgi:hypothetical protein
MAKYFDTKDDSIGAKLNHKGEYVVARMAGGVKLIEKLNPEDIEDAKKIADIIITEALPLAQKVINAIKDFFQGIFQRFPPAIIIQGDTYRYTIQPNPFKGVDRVFYMSETYGEDRAFEFEDKHLGKAKNMLFKALKEEGYL